MLKAFKTFLGPVFHENSESEVRLQKSRPAAKLRHVYYEKNQLKPRKTYTHLALVPGTAVQGIASYKNIQFCMIIIFYLKLDISARARAHACAQMCAAHKCAQCWNTGQAISENKFINKICILLVYARFGRTCILAQFCA